MNSLLKSFSPGSIAAVVALAMIAGYDLFVPSASQASKGKQKPIAQLVREGAELREDLEGVKGMLAARTWTGAEDEVAPKAMALVSERARKYYVSVSAFRPQRTVVVDGITQLNYLVAAEGSFPEVMRFIRSFEAKDSKIAVKSVQMTSADGATDQVRASISLVAYRLEGSNGQ